MLFESVQSEILTVTEYSARLGRALREVGAASIEGEVQKVHPTPRGMLYFDVTDGESLLSCKVFARDAAALEHTPRAGDLVQVTVDRPDFYAARGSVSLIVSAVSLAGEGELLRRRAALLDRLTSEGLCARDRRRALPRFPRAVGVIAGEGSDGMSDVIRALTDRWPAVHIITCGSLVQGKAAPGQLIDALARLQDHPAVDVIVMARGGGSVQDLVCFDDEGLCRALFACAVPVVCAIGHTDNNPVCNHVAWPAFTPSRSAELVVPAAGELRRSVASAGDRLRGVPQRINLAAERVGVHGARVNCAPVLDARAVAVRARASEVGDAANAFLGSHQNGLERARGRLDAVPHRAARDLAAEREILTAADRALARTGEHLAATARQLGELSTALGRDTHRHLSDVRRELAHRSALIAAQDFRRRGWLLASTSDGAAVRSVTDLSPGTDITLSLHDGSASAVIGHITPDPGSSQP